MTGHPMREFRDTLGHAKAKLQADARAAFGTPDIWPADPVERAADKVLRKARARPVQRVWPWWAWFVFGAAAMLGAMGLAVIAGDMLATGVATALQADVARW